MLNGRGTWPTSQACTHHWKQPIPGHVGSHSCPSWDSCYSPQPPQPQPQSHTDYKLNPSAPKSNANNASHAKSQTFQKTCTSTRVKLRACPPKPSPYSLSTLLARPHRLVFGSEARNPVNVIEKCINPQLIEI